MNTRLLAMLSLMGLVACASPSHGSRRTLGSIERKDRKFDALVPPGAEMEVLSGGYDWCEGPVWVKEGGYLLFSVIPPNKICKWKEGEGVSIYLKPSGLLGPKDLRPEPGSNGLAIDPQGRLTMCQHGERQVARMDAPLSSPASKFVPLASKYEGKRLNSPNDLCFHSSGAL